MKRLYTFSSLQQVPGFTTLYFMNTAASTMPWANDSFAQQSLFSFSQRSIIL